MIKRWLIRFWLRDDWIRAAAEEGFLAFAREMEGLPAEPARKRSAARSVPAIEDSRDIDPAVDPERTPSFA